ncbi:MAG: universal stress protein [Caldilineaceae bacterium]
MSKRTVLIPQMDRHSVGRFWYYVVRDYFRTGGWDIVLMRALTPVLLTAESQTYADIVAEQSYMGMYGSYTPHQERQWAMATQESETYRAELQGDLENEAERLREQGYRVSTEVHFGEPAQRIIDFVNDMNINVVAMATHGRTGLGVWCIGECSRKGLRGVAVPVLLWRGVQRQRPHQSQLPNRWRKG